MPDMAVELLECHRFNLREHIRKVRRNEAEIMHSIGVESAEAELKDVERALAMLRAAPDVFRAAVGNEVTVCVPEAAYEALRKAVQPEEEG